MKGNSCRETAAALLADALTEAAYRWSPADDVRFVADISVIDSRGQSAEARIFVELAGSTGL